MLFLKTTIDYPVHKLPYVKSTYTNLLRLMTYCICIQPLISDNKHPYKGSCYACGLPLLRPEEKCCGNCVRIGTNLDGSTELRDCLEGTCECHKAVLQDKPEPPQDWKEEWEESFGTYLRGRIHAPVRQQMTDFISALKERAYLEGRYDLAEEVYQEVVRYENDRGLLVDSSAIQAMRTISSFALARGQNDNK